MLLPTSPGIAFSACSLFLLVIYLPSAWEAHWSRSKPSPSHQGAALLHHPHNRVIWMDASAPVPFQEALASLLTAYSVVLWPSFCIWQAQCVQAFLLKYVLFCEFFARLGSTNKSDTSLPFFPLRLFICPCFTFISSVLSFISCFLAYLAKTIISFILLYNQATVGPRSLYSPRKWHGRWLIRRGALLQPFTILCSFSPLTLVFTLLFAGTGDVQSDQNFSTNRFLHYPLRDLCFLVILVVSIIFCATTDAVFGLTLISLELPELRVLTTVPVVIRPKSFLILFFTVLHRTLCPACFLATLFLSAIYGPGIREFPNFWGFMAFRHAPNSRKGPGSNNNRRKRYSIVCKLNAKCTGPEK